LKIRWPLEAEMADLKREVDELGDTAKGLTSDFGPLDLKEENNSKPKTGSASDTLPCIATPRQRPNSSISRRTGSSDWVGKWRFSAVVMAL
jgi:hypothetical protein